MTFQKRQNYGDNKKISGCQGLWGRNEQMQYSPDLSDSEMSVWATLCMCGSRALWGNLLPFYFAMNLKLLLKKNETKLHQATQDQCMIKRGIVLKDLFQCQPFFKSLYLNLLQYWSCFMFWWFGCEACGISAPWLEIKPATPPLEGEVLTTGPPGKSPKEGFLSGQTENNFYKIKFLKC